MLFKEVVGQTDIKEKLINLVKSGKVPHAMMMLGPEGNGSLGLALALAQYIQCENKGGDDSCGVCSSCTKNEKFIHPDVYFTYPVVTKKSGEPPISTDYIKEWRAALVETPYMNANDWLQSIGAENRQGNITVRECHEVIKRMGLKTYESEYKIQIIWLAEYLKEAGNTLLKVIEEPTPNTIFILVVENIDLVLNTIISRTQLVKINPVRDEDVQHALLSRFEMDENAAKRIARISDGNFNAALSWGDGVENANDKLLHKWLVSCFNLKLKPSGTNTMQLLEWVEEISKIGRENQKIFLKYAIFFLRECSMIAVTGNSEKLDGEELKFAKGLSARLGISQFESLLRILNLVHYHVERNANPKILFLSNSFKIASVFKDEEVAEWNY
jgi:DNA polymerase-3 subunit delta'